jgi:enoyl-CoA hydratase/carnithine racemase
MALVIVGEGEVDGDALYADYLILRQDAVLVIDSPRAWGGAVWRIGRRALLLMIAGGGAGAPRITAPEALRHGLCDEVVPAGSDPVEWLRGRSAIALESAAALLARRGGDALERAEFARLFGTGEPQAGLTAFLRRRNRTGGRNDER